MHCTAPMQYRYPLRVGPCNYHETHEFAKELAITIAANALTSHQVYEDEDKTEPKPELLYEDDKGNIVPWRAYEQAEKP